MKKIKYYERVKPFSEKKFIEYTGYYEKITNDKLESIQVVYRRDENGWRATELTTGLSITLLEFTKNKCMERVRELFQAVFMACKSDYHKGCIKDLQDYLNKQLDLMKV